jgi:rfaE bifunctional protein kinase chain/domain
MNELHSIFESIEKLKVGVIGDVMLDSYIWGQVDRISPEAPVPIVSLHHKEQRIGGAANVGLNCRSLGAEVFIISVLGDDDEAATLEKLLQEKKMDTGYLVRSKSRITTNKTRVLSRNQQMMRLDAEVTHDLNSHDEKIILARLEKLIAQEDPDLLIFEDYNKGVLTEKLIADAITLCKQSGVITAVDPKRKNFFSYKGVDIFKPNLKEVKEALNMLFGDVDLYLLKDIHAELQKILHHKISLITLSDKGIFYQQDEQAAVLPSHLRSIADVSGAGDTVIAVASLVYAATKNVYLMAEIANIAGGLVCEEVGTAAIEKGKLLAECELLLS